ALQTPEARFDHLYALIERLQKDAEISKTRFQEDAEISKTRFQEEAEISKTRFNKLEAEAINSREWRAWRDERDMKMFRANALIVFIKALCKRQGKQLDKLDNLGQDAQHCSQRFSLAYTLFDRKTWSEKTGPHDECLDVLKEASKTLQSRNDTAHQSNTDFAKLLIDPYYKGDPEGEELKLWASIFGYVYRDDNGRSLTLEEIAKMNETDLVKFLPKGKDPQ
ncbi:MAG: hypothetical protein LQ341_006663, partial [Variospora aurantia]